ncbi:MAG: response regulator transcription factor [Flammeovirgaceae bacterium]
MTNPSPQKPLLLLAEDDTSLGMVVKDYLNISGYEVCWCEDGKIAWENFQKQKFDLCLLDVMLPEMDGFSLATSIRQSDAEIPILMLTAKSLKEDKIKGFKLGADDYIVKPFNIEELVFRIEVFLRRSKTVAGKDGFQKTNLSQIGKYLFDYENLTLQFQEEIKNLTQKEADILKILLEQKGQVVKRSEILIKVWGEDDFFLGRSLDVFVSKLRKYLKEDRNIEIQTIYGIGFKLTFY